ncbi:MAG: response regulator [Proteobacteria bacterium]|nr:response regulator [Pseudomonadota bacterium]
MPPTVLHVEDDPFLADLVRASLTSFGLGEDLLWVPTVSQATELIGRRKAGGLPLDLILVDVQLPDGTGLEVLHAVRSNPAWAATPVIVLSGERDSGVVAEAYALGANAFLSKTPNNGQSLFDALQSLEEFWFQAATLPQSLPTDPVREALSRAVSLRARVGEFCARLARVFPQDSELTGFWLDRALNASNLASLLKFLLSLDGVPAFPADLAARVAAIQERTEASLRMVEEQFRAAPRPGADRTYGWALDLTDDLDEEVLAEALALLFPAGPAAVRALKARVVLELTDVGRQVSGRAGEEVLRRRAQDLLERTRRLGERAAVSGAGSRSSASTPVGA